VQPGEAQHETKRPYASEPQQGERSKDGEKALTTALSPKPDGQRSPRLPRSPKIQAREAKPPTHRAREHDRFEGIPQQDGNEARAQKKGG